MDPDLAKKIHKHLLDAVDALKRAEWAGDGITDGDERRAFIELVHDAIAPLRFDLLPMLYRGHPDLEPDGDEEEPHIDSTLRWDEVSLPPGITEAEIDAMIFSLLKPRRQKMAKIVGNAGMRFHDESKPFSFEIIAARTLRWRKLAASKATAICAFGVSARYGCPNRAAFIQSPRRRAAARPAGSPPRSPSRS